MWIAMRCLVTIAAFGIAAGSSGCGAKRSEDDVVGTLSRALDQTEKSLSQIEKMPPDQADPLLREVMDRHRVVSERAQELNHGDKLQPLLDRVKDQQLRVKELSDTMKARRQLDKLNAMHDKLDTKHKEADVVGGLKQLQGGWRTTSISIGGTDLSEAAVKAGSVMLIAGNQMRFEGVGKIESQTVAADSSNDPATIDITTDINDKKVLYAGIYKLDGDMLTICRTTQPGEPRPTKFEKGEGIAVEVHQRVK